MGVTAAATTLAETNFCVSGGGEQTNYNEVHLFPRARIRSFLSYYFKKLKATTATT